MAWNRVRIRVVLVALLAAALGAARAPAQEREGRKPPSGLLERLDAEERAREKARAETEAQEAAVRKRHEREVSDARRRQELAAAEAARAFELRREAMREWHASFDAVLGPVLVARQRLYRRLPRGMFARVRQQCVELGRAADEAAALYTAAPERHVETLARDLLAVFRNSARFCAGGAYFSFTVEEGRVHQIVGDLIRALDAFGLEFPRSGLAPEAPTPVAAPASGSEG